MAKASKEERRKNVIEVLNKARSMELQAITQYMSTIIWMTWTTASWRQK